MKADEARDDEATGDQGRKSFQTDRTTPGEADPASMTERADHYPLSHAGWGDRSSVVIFALI